ncbi:MAG: ACP phosphodiesterase [Pseudomonas sp. 34-62-33]|nr:MAG: ACP phosphodiesterase [Pseudomonas sp. 34-62-33]
MSKTYNVAVLVGSLRKASINRKLALALADLAPPSLNLEILEIGDLPLYNEDADGDTAPVAYAPFRSKLKAADAVLFITPEYNRSIPAPMKNAIDVGSRPYGQSGFSGKPGAVLSASPGAIGGFGAGAGNFFDENGVLSDGIKPFLQKFIDAYAAWVAKQA